MNIKQSLEKDARYTLLQTWLAEVLDVNFTISIASADASFRRYFRVHLEEELDEVETLILMDAPPENESLSPFYEIASDWKAHDINTPKIHAKDAELGFMLLEDFGDQTLLNELETSSSDEQVSLYRQALKQLVALQVHKQTVEPQFDLPIYSKELLQRECELFRVWYLQTHCEYVLTEKENAYLDDLFESLIISALAQKQVPVHRDYHSRNLMYRDTQALGIIDFQDAVTGPLYYDAVSLLKDCYIKLDSNLRDKLFFDYYQSLQENHLTEVDTQAARKTFDLMGMQRHLKAIGIFCRLNHRDGKSHYLLDIPRTASYILELEHSYPELEKLCKILRVTLKERFEQ